MNSVLATALDEELNGVEEAGDARDASSQSGRLDLNQRPFGTSRQAVDVGASVRVRIVLWVRVRGRAGPIERYVGYPSGTTARKFRFAWKAEVGGGR